MKVLTSDDSIAALRSTRRILHDQIAEYIRVNFTEHRLQYLIGAILQAKGFVTQVAGLGPDGGVDILARGPYGSRLPKMCVQVKSSKNQEGVPTFRALQGSMHSFNATHGLLVCWGGFTTPLLRAARLDFFRICLWDADKVVEETCQNYARLPDELRQRIPLERAWVLVRDEKD